MSVCPVKGDRESPEGRDFAHSEHHPCCAPASEGGEQARKLAVVAPHEAPVLTGLLPVSQGGFGILEEMCVNYVHYYPQTQLEVCKSTVDPGFLREYFHLVNR